VNAELSEPITSPAAHAARARFPVWSLIAVVVAVLMAAPLLFVNGSETLRTLSVTFVSIVLEALPFVMLGSLIGGLIEVFVSRERLSSLLPRNRTLAIMAAGLLGIVFPVCECAIIPVTRRLVRKGVPFSVAVAYLIAGPIVNPLVAASTYVAYAGDWLVTFARLGCGFGIAVFIATVIDEWFAGQKALRPGAIDAVSEHACGPGCDHDHGSLQEGAAHSTPLPIREGPGERATANHPAPHPPAVPPQRGTGGRNTTTAITHALEHAADDFLQVSQFLIIGAFAAAMSQSLISRQAFVNLAETPAITILLMMAMAVLLNLCSEADAFVAASFRNTLPLSAQMAFLVLGPMLDLKLIAMYLSFVRKRALLVMILLMCVLVFAMMLTLHYFAWGSNA
jgi:uncharacterized membrane protein YraQ (UPF0718 family)